MTPTGFNPLKICDITQSYAPTGGGVRTYIHAKREYLRTENRADHVLIVPGEQDTTVRGSRSVTHTVASPLVPGSSTYRLFLRSGKALQILREENPDVIEVHCAYNLPWTALYHRQSRSSVVVGVYMTDLPDVYVYPYVARALGRAGGAGARKVTTAYIRSLYNRLDATIAISPALVDKLRSIGVNNVEYIPLGVGTDTFHPARRSEALRARLGVVGDGLMLTYVGRLDTEKRVKVVVDAFERLPAHLNATLVIAGDGPLRAELESRAARFGRIHVLPFISDREELATLLASADMYVSGMPNETFGLSVVEAQACGLPVVGVASGAMLDRVPRGLGLLGSVDAVDEMASNIVALAGQDLRAIGRDARRLAERELSWHRTFEQVMTLYERLRSQRSTR
jgi:alpha-1,6-mannosyltransferase